MTKIGMKESVEGKAYLPEVEVGIFDLFLQFAMKLDYETSGKIAQIKDEQAGPGFGKSRSYEPPPTATALMEKQFKGMQCAASVTLQLELQRRLLSPGTTRDALIDHAKLFVFADRYLISDLGTLSLFKLHRDLVGYELGVGGEAARVKVAHLVRYVFANTARNPPLKDDTIKISLRKLVSSYVAAKSGVLVCSKCFQSLFEEEGEFSYDYALAIALLGTSTP